MSEIADAFRRIERPNVRTNTSVQPFNCALRSFAQACFQRMKQQLYWVKVRRIFRQVAQACTDSLDRRFHAPNLVGGDIVDHHNVPALERWDQTLLYVSQEGLSIHGSFDQHRSHDAGLTQPSGRRRRPPQAPRALADQALAASRPAARRLFFIVMPWRAKNRESALRTPCIRPLGSAGTLSFSVRPDSSLMR